MLMCIHKGTRRVTCVLSDTSCMCSLHLQARAHAHACAHTCNLTHMSLMPAQEWACASPQMHMHTHTPVHIHVCALHTCQTLTHMLTNM